MDSKLWLDVMGDIGDTAGMTIDTCFFYAERLDPSRNMARFYVLAVSEDLFGDRWLERRWGRIGSQGQRKTDRLENDADLQKRIAVIARQKTRRGYQQK